MLFGLGPLEIIGIIIVIIFILFLPKILRSRLLSSVTKVAEEVEGKVDESKKILVKLCNEKGKAESDPLPTIENYLEFFVIPPVDMDPQGIVPKLQKILEMSEDRFHYMADRVAPQADSEWQASIIMTLKSILALNSVAKMVRHNLELARKTGNLQILLMLQMNLPLLLKMVNAQFEGIKSFSEGNPIGDGLGPLVAGLLLQGVEESQLEERDEMVVGCKKLEGRTVVIARAKGPGGRVGKVGKTITSLIKEKEIKMIITVDAALKMEGETTGTVAEGIGVGVGGPGVDKWIIEEEMMEHNLQIDAVIVKMSPEEAICQMNKKILESSNKALKVVSEAILRSPEGSNVLVVGVGNSNGIPNIICDLEKINIKKRINSKKENQKK
ncbi:DUF1512 family protein [Methanobacterium ferruginis]|uniref:DUF1512 family protein n=1 Tax=Methanobacterium ferruginis TaxID=710191 RepID=UPI0025728A2C|nr:DUF1512 family protein [Methanobacterium ferruginis]BDZ69251.1 hypothetical protein GCM10025860_26990 [Methanobacterium ferruginis]